MMPKGFLFAGVRCGLKNKRKDVGLIVSDRPATIAGVFTQNLIKASCVDYTRKVVETGSIRAIAVNSGNANCCTGKQGERDTAKMAELAAKALDLDLDDVAVANTGIIGSLLDMSKVEKGIELASKELTDNPKQFLEAILTTDLVDKSATKLVDGATIYMAGKGSGMIAPNMATMLGFIVTDLEVEREQLDKCLRKAIDKSFHCLTVDTDTSTNDMVLALANGASGVKTSEEKLTDALTEVCVSLAKQIAKDGEGATKLVEIRVTGTDDPKKIARTIADSPLVKTAMFGCDPNWGRIIAAAGRSGVNFDPQKAVLKMGSNGENHLLFENGSPAAYDQKRASTSLKSNEVLIDLYLDEGETATVYTCDFGYGYVRINAEYHT